MKKITTIALFVLTGLVFTVNAQDYSSVVKEYLGKKAATHKTSGVTYSDWEINNTDPSASLKATVLSVQQKYNGVPVMFSDAVLVVRDGKVISEKDNFLPLAATMKKVNLKPQLSLQDATTVLRAKSVVNGEHVDGKLVYFPVEDQLKLSYLFIYHSGNLEKMMVLDAVSGEVIRDEITTLSCSFEHVGVDLNSGTNEKNISGLDNSPLILPATSAATAAVPNASYNVYPFPVEAPTFGNRAIVNNPWILAASPLGWHNDGSTNHTITRGNNVHAYEDTKNLNTVGFSPDSPSLNFNYPFDKDENAQNYQSASITNLFYVNNMVHDVFYQLGFTETARNFQNNNLGKGGSGGDYVRAEAHDGKGLDNANFSSSFEGATSSYPRMQMYLWSPTSIQNIFIASPASGSSRFMSSKLASFGPQLTATPLNGNLKLALPADGCTPLTNGATLSGNIAVIDRGDCAFTIKVKAAQDAGAKAVVIANIAGGSFGTMGGTDATVTIPAVMVEKADGDYLKSLMATQTVNVNLKDDKSTYKYLDGSFDSGIVIHEYGHGISNRMTGTGLGCLSTSTSAEQMGEGWSDYFGLLLTYQPGTSMSLPRGIGTYATGAATTGPGIRPAKYSPDFAINNFTYGATKQMAGDVHSIGFVWATMLWDMTAKMVEKYGYAPDVLSNPNAGNAKSLQLVVDGLKLHGCNPSFIDGRDAIIEADALANGGANECLIWGAFAKRGLGVKATTGAKNTVTDNVEDFTVPAKCAAELSTTNASLDKSKLTIFPNPAKDQFYIKNGSVKERLLVTIYNMSGGIVSKTYVKDGEPVNVRNLTKGVYLVNIEGLNFKTNEKIIINN